MRSASPATNHANSSSSNNNNNNASGTANNRSASPAVRMSMLAAPGAAIDTSKDSVVECGLGD
jgi:hypothetical protein